MLFCFPQQWGDEAVLSLQHSGPMIYHDILLVLLLEDVLDTEIAISLPEEILQIIFIGSEYIFTLLHLVRNLIHIILV